MKNRPPFLIENRTLAIWRAVSDQLRGCDRDPATAAEIVWIELEFAGQTKSAAELAAQIIVRRLEIAAAGPD